MEPAPPTASPSQALRRGRALAVPGRRHPESRARERANSRIGPVVFSSEHLVSGFPLEVRAGGHCTSAHPTRQCSKLASQEVSAPSANRKSRIPVMDPGGSGFCRGKPREILRERPCISYSRPVPEFAPPKPAGGTRGITLIVRSRIASHSRRSRIRPVLSGRHKSLIPLLVSIEPRRTVVSRHSGLSRARTRISPAANGRHFSE